MVNNTDEWTLQRLRRSVCGMLDKLKTHPNQSYNEVVQNLILEYKEHKEDDKHGPSA